MDPITKSELTRRNILRGAALGAVAVPALVACGDDDSGEPEGAASPEESSSSPRKPESGDAGAEALADTSAVEVGGAVFLDDPNVVITQPKAGEFHAFDRTCTHQQCPVTDLLAGKIHCQCHGSLYDPATGENVGGPAPAPLATFPIQVQGNQILAG